MMARQPVANALRLAQIAVRTQCVPKSAASHVLRVRNRNAIAVANTRNAQLHVPRLARTYRVPNGVQGLWIAVTDAQLSVANFVRQENSVKSADHRRRSKRRLT